MEPLQGLLALYALNKTTGAGANDTNLTAYALTSWGWIVVRLPWDMWTIIGNDAGLNTNLKGVTVKRYGTDAAVSEAVNKLKSYQANQVTTARETAQARYYANPRLTSVKWRGSVWAFDERDNIATVDSGHFLGKCLQGTQSTCSAMISTLLQQPGADLQPLSSSTVGRCHSRRR